MRNRSTSCPVVVASWGSLSSRHRPVKRGNRMASPDSAWSCPQPAVWLGDTVSSALSTSSTSPGSHHRSAGTRESTRAGRSRRISGANRSGNAARSASENPAPHRPTVR